MIQFHSHRFSGQCYHCLFAEGEFLHDSALAGVAALANVSTIGNKEKLPT